MKQQSIIFEEELRQVQFSDSKSIKNKFLQKMRKPQNLDGYNQMRKIPFQLSEAFHENRLKCILCKDYYIKFTIAQCGHSFCYYCIFEQLLKSHRCPCCQTVLKGLHFIQCHTIDEFIKNSKVLVKNSTIPSRKKQFKEWKLKKKITNFNIGDTLDVLDTEHIWCVGSIINILNQKEILIHFQGQNKAYNEYIPISSPRLSPLGLFTNRTDILLYYPSQDENSMFNQIRQIGSQNQENELYNYLIIQQQTANSNIILAVEQPNRIGLQSLLQLVVFIREIQDELYNET
ncbi:unnamed protein product (macronuclear) [Paramecium tetraurelia]|uniref:RING-type domain-containing protein n=1 Tax=Paramecium tetraurelia TaxID=5888 RepID=A0C4S3_PARTE|nr:uncharacterized protein GSPATT00006289001 [Paramecium tetraurelia]CAK65790.1 unnamed protein product [Paramecium tetraurelia]|eukprot:XP_001433187.1 hypothetical protein (macronuclear) [Paramecium tetraurelia strain d4-2]